MSSVMSASYSEYAPLRYEITRPFCKKVSETIAKERFLRPGDLGTSNYSKYLWSLMSKTVDLDTERAGFATNELRFSEAYASFLAGNRIIYDFSKKLLSSLVRTDADSIPLKSIKFPNESFYLHFGCMNWPKDFPVSCEGVYVERSSRDREDVIYFTPILPGRFSKPFWMDVSEEIDSSIFIICLDDDISNITDYFKCEKESFDEAIAEQRAWCGNDTIVKLMGTDRMDALANAFIARIAVNCMLYLNAVPDDIEDRWDDRAPKDLVFQAENSDKDSVRKSSTRALEKKDYIKVKLVGKKYEQHNPLHQKPGSKQVPHIRRGHFRNQAFGPEWSLHRVIFIPPVLINAEDGEIPGRIIEI